MKTIMQAEIRADGRLEISGYVNVTGKKSRPLRDKNNKMFIEEIEEGAFQRAIDRAKSIRMLLDHEQDRELANTNNNTLEVYEDAVGLRAKSIIDDKEVIEGAKNGKLKGWSFDMSRVSDEIEERTGDYPLRKVRDFDMSEITLVMNKVPAYPATSVEVRAENDDTEYRTFADGIDMVETPKEAHKKTIDYSYYEKTVKEVKENKNV